MGILDRLMGSAQGTAARTTRTGNRSTTGKGMGRAGSGRATSGRGRTAGNFKGFGSGGRTTTARTGRGRSVPASSGGLGKLIGSLTGRR